MTIHDMNCAAIDDRLADYLEGDLDAATKRQFEAHVASCVRCTALVRDLERIRAGAAELPELTPSMDLWNGIARRIETPVVPFVAVTGHDGEEARRRSREAGFVEHLVKPVHIETLRNLLEQV